MRWCSKERREDVEEEVGEIRFGEGYEEKKKRGRGWKRRRFESLGYGGELAGYLKRFTREKRAGDGRRGTGLVWWWWPSWAVGGQLVGSWQAFASFLACQLPPAARLGGGWG